MADVWQVKRVGDDEALEKALLDLVQMTETESRASGWGVAPAWYEELAILYRKRKDYLAEVAVLERFANQRHAPGGEAATVVGAAGQGEGAARGE